MSTTDNSTEFTYDVRMICVEASTGDLQYYGYIVGHHLNFACSGESEEEVLETIRKTMAFNYFQPRTVTAKTVQQSLTVSEALEIRRLSGPPIDVSA